VVVTLPFVAPPSFHVPAAAEEIVPRRVAGVTRGSRCWALVSIPSPSPATTSGLGQALGSGFHVHLELELKRFNPEWRQRTLCHFTQEA